MLLYVLLGLGGLFAYKKFFASDESETEDPFVEPPLIPAGDEVVFADGTTVLSDGTVIPPPLPDPMSTDPFVGPPKPGALDGLGLAGLASYASLSTSCQYWVKMYLLAKKQQAEAFASKVHDPKWEKKFALATQRRAAARAQAYSLADCGPLLDLLDK